MFALAMSANAETDGCTYDVVDGTVLTSKWIASNTVDARTWTQDYTDLSMAKGARTATIGKVGGKEKILITQTGPATEELEAPGYMYIMDFFTGKLEKKLQLSCEGKPLNGTLCVNQVGCDDFGHVWVCGYKGTSYVVNDEDPSKSYSNPIVVYQVTDFETGACTKAFEVILPEDEKDAAGRLDYYDIIGDITRQEAACVIMSPVAGASNLFVYGWRAEQGGEFGPLMSDGEYVSGIMEESYPAEQTSWGTAPTVSIIKDEDFTGEMFYVDGFTTCPSLYNTSGSMLSSFATVDKSLTPALGTNGVCEFNMNGWPYLFYSISQYDKDPGCQTNVVKLGEGSNFDEMQLMWTFPTVGLGTLSDGGTRYHACNARVYADENGVEGAYLLTYKCCNGVGVYTVAPENWIDPYANAVNDIVADDVNAPVEYFNLNGVAVDADNLTPGLYITRQGSKANKVVVK